MLEGYGSDDRSAGTGDELLADLTAEQAEAVTTRASPLCVVARAGSGKTRVVTRRIAWQSGEGHIDPRRALAITFSRRAAGELRRRLRSLGLRDAVAAGTFHAVALAQLREHWQQRGHRPREVLESRAALLARLNPGSGRPVVAQLSTEIGWARARLVTPARYPEMAAAAGRRSALAPERVADVYEAYEQAKRDRRVIDFDDVLALCHATVTRDEAFGAAQRWRHRHLFVDEFQDVNPLQFALLRAWLGPDSTLLLVGDPDQAIYGWNGADPRLMEEVTAHFPSCAVVTLNTNFRSSPAVLEPAARLLERTAQPAVRPRGPEPTVAVVDVESEATHIARQVRARHRPGGSWRTQAVLARTNSQLAPIRDALRRAAIPVADHSFSRQRSTSMMNLLRRVPGPSSLAQLVTDLKAGDTVLEDPARSDPDDAGGGRAVDELIEQADSHLDLDPEATVATFAATLAGGGSETDFSGDGVTLTTFHGAKGLEWPIVHIVGLEKGLVPHQRARTRAARDEERRLLYVALTRAEQELHLSWCRTRRFGDVLRQRQPSPWLDKLAVGDTAADVAEPVAGLAAARRRLSENRPADPGTDTAASDAEVDTAPTSSALRGALEGWRADVAGRSRVEPQVILPDRVIDLIDARRPTRREELIDVTGLAPGHVDRWGSELVAIISAHTEG